MTLAARSPSLADVLRRTARRTPAHLAIVCGEVRWRYAELVEICDNVAAGLAGLGVGKGDRVAVLARNSHAFVALRFAVARLGAVLVPINFMLKAQEVGFVLRHSGAMLLATDSELAPVAREAAIGSEVRLLVWLPSEHCVGPVPHMARLDAWFGHRAEPPSVEIAGDDLAQIVYTSGTESAPKGAMLSHAALIAEYVSCIVDADISAHDTMLHALPLYHCAQLDAFLGPCLMVGATSIITAQPSPDNVLPLIERHGITAFFAPPTVWISLLRSPLFDVTHLDSLGKGYYGASIMPVEVLRELARRLPKVALRNLYGQTEIAPVATMLGPQDQLRKAGSAGKPVLNVETRVVDDDMIDCAPGEIGEVVHRSPQLMSGYWHDAERTAAAFEGGWFHSGDLGVLDDEGFLTIVDRKKDMIKTGGENVASREVEETIYGLPAVAEVAVVGVPHPLWVEGIVAIVVPRAGHVLDEAAVLAHCRAQLAGFKQPKRVVVVDALPKNPSGKLLKRELRLMHARIFEDLC